MDPDVLQTLEDWLLPESNDGIDLGSPLNFESVSQTSLETRTNESSYVRARVLWLSKTLAIVPIGCWKRPRYE